MGNHPGIIPFQVGSPHPNVSIQFVSPLFTISAYIPPLHYHLPNVEFLTNASMCSTF